MLRLLLVSLVSASVAAQTYVVDASNGPGTHYTDIPAAVAQVPDGAVLRVRPGIYSTFTVANKSLTILGDSRTTVQMRGFTVGPHGPAHRVTIQSASVGMPIAWPGIRITRCQGHVVLDSLQLSSFSLGPTPAAVLIEDSADVHLLDVTQPNFAGGMDLEVARSCVEITRCTWIGRNQYTTAGTGFPAIAAVDSRLTVFGSTITGGRGGSDLFMVFGNGGPGVLARGCSIDVGPATSISGGEGGIDPAGLGCYQVMRPGGAGLELQQRSVVRAVGAVVRGGCSSGMVCGPTGCTSVAPSVVADATSSFTRLTTTTPVLVLQGVQAPSSFVDVVLGAGPNEVALLAFGFTPACLQLPLDYVRDRPVWAQYFTFPGLQLPGQGSNTATIVVRS